MEVLILIVLLAGLPRSLWCIPAFLLMWSLSGASSGGGSGAGDNFGYMLLPWVVLAVALWGVYSNLRKLDQLSFGVSPSKDNRVDDESK
ncbi:MAG: hypothetical protein K0U72_06640 [Gammaproteobacteria bacterium]|nr:hypothetical protein [Gammaproteobacteria bacterium]